MEIGYILFNLKPGMKKNFLQSIRKIKGVKEANIVLGNWDAVAEVEAEDVEGIEKIYLNEIDKLMSITSSRLYIMACPRTRK
ncbi:MAG TPA: Lrp/AsnC ligand binding domain-containing protein [Candidatus Bathyarchaeia archaeon]